MAPGDEVLLFTASGTFRNHPGRVVELRLNGVMVQPEGEPGPMLFSWSELVPPESNRHIGGAE